MKTMKHDDDFYDLDDVDGVDYPDDLDDRHTRVDNDALDDHLLLTNALFKLAQTRPIPQGTLATEPYFCIQYNTMTG